MKNARQNVEFFRTLGRDLATPQESGRVRPMSPAVRRAANGNEIGSAELIPENDFEDQVEVLDRLRDFEKKFEELCDARQD